MQDKTCMVVDVSNLFWRLVSAQKNSYTVNDPEVNAAMALQGCLQSLRKHFRSVNPCEIALAFEGKDNWRKAYTRSTSCYSKRIYKANRIVDSSMAILFETLKSFKELVSNYSSLIILDNDELEGDDCVSAYADYKAAQGYKVVILSGDKDFASLITSKIWLLNPDDSKYRTLEDLCGVNDAKYFIFEKCFRGDSGDNVMSAYPRVRKTKLQKAYTDSFALSNLLAESWDMVDPEENVTRSMNVGKMFEENKLLMDLRGQPDRIKGIMNETVVQGYQNRKAFKYFNFVKFLNDNNLKDLVKKSNEYVPLLSLIDKTTVTVLQENNKKETSGFSF